MSFDPETTRIVRSWLDEGVTQLPDRVLDSVLDQVPATPQRRVTWWPAWRTPVMNKLVTLGLGAAAVVVLLYLGTQVVSPYGGFGGPGAEATPTPQPENLPDSGALEPGAYRVNPGPYTPVQLVVAVPPGWVADRFAVVVKNPGEPTQVGLAPDVVTYVYSDACDADAGRTEIGPTADALVAALVAQQNIEVTGVSDTLLGGYPAQRVDIAYPGGLDGASCRNADHLRIWADEAETLFLELSDGERGSVYVADIADRRVVVTTVTGPEATRSDIAERDEIVSTIQVGP